MVGQRRLRLVCCCLPGLLAGCGQPAAIHVETTIYSDGSCDRMIWQPKDKFLPDRALKPEWNARWKIVSDVSGPPGEPHSKTSMDDCKYFIARARLIVRGRSLRTIALPTMKSPTQGRVSSRGATRGRIMGSASNTAGRKSSRTS